MNDKRDMYVEKFKAKIDEWNAEIDRLNARAKQTEADTRMAYLDQVRELEKQRDETREKINRLQEAGEGAWEDLKAGTEMTFEAMRVTFESIRERFKF